MPVIVGIDVVERLRAFGRKVLMLGGTPHGIAGGFALGVTLSLVPIPFLGMVVALALAPVLRLNPPATYLGTAVINPVTGAAFYFAELWVGMTLTGQSAPAFAQLRQMSASQWASLALDMLGPFALGAAVCMTAAVVLTYPTLRWATARYQARRARRAVALSAAENVEAGTGSEDDSQSQTPAAE